MSASSSKRSSDREKEIGKRKDDEITDQEDEGIDEIETSEHNDPLAEPSALSAEALARYREAQERTGVIYISRIPPGMSPNKVRHLMSAYGEVGRVYLQQEGMYRIIGAECVYSPIVYTKGSFSRSQKRLLAQKVYDHEEAALYRRLGRIQRQTHCSFRRDYVECTAGWGEEGHSMEGRRLDYEISIPIQVVYAY